MRAALGTNNVDHCTRLCHASSVAALLEGIGSGAVTDVFGDAKHADVILLTGTNTTANHPVAATFFKQAAQARHEADRRRPAPAGHRRLRHAGTASIQPGHRRGVLQRGHARPDRARARSTETFIRDRTENFEALQGDWSPNYPPERVAPVCGIDGRHDPRRRPGHRHGAEP